MTKDNIDYFSTIEQQLHHISVHDIDEIRDELAEQGFMKQRKNQTKKKKAQIRLQHYVSTDGDDIYMLVENNKQNDYLTNKKAKKTTHGYTQKIFLVHMSLYLMMHQVIRQSRKRLC